MGFVRVVLTVLVMGALLAIGDAAFGRIWQHDTQTRVSTFGPGESQHGVIVFPGFSNTSAVAEALVPYLPNTKVIAIDYPQWGINPAEIYHKTIAAARTAGVTHLVLYGNSMGGMVVAEWLRHYQSEKKQLFLSVGPILDTSPSSPATAKSPLPLSIGRYWRGGPLSGFMYSVAVKLYQYHSPWPGAQPGSDAKLVSELYRHMTNPPMPAVTAQCAFMSRFRLKSGEFSNHTALFVLGQGDDPLVDVAPAVNDWRAAFGGHLQKIVDESRPPGWHTPVVELPHGTAEIILRRLMPA